MKLRIAMWASAGALVVVCLRLYLAAIFPSSLDADRPVLDLVYLTCPIALLRHHAVSFYQVLFANAATYAFVGAVVETVRRQHTVHKFRMISN
ncbi:MAG TPA: hypothetical protein VHY48_03715 [Acidobacteriaceae bacterium]|jgi:hypothetical protein|nr:hypothetical protein [Acidobacteriaceae bacterium]